MKKSKRLSKIYYTAPNGIKIEIKIEQKGFQVPKDMFFPDQELVDVKIHEPRLNVALTDELNAKGSVEVAFKYGEVRK